MCLDLPVLEDGTGDKLKRLDYSCLEIVISIHVDPRHKVDKILVWKSIPEIDSY